MSSHMAKIVSKSRDSSAGFEGIEILIEVVFRLSLLFRVSLLTESESVDGTSLKARFSSSSLTQDNPLLGVLVDCIDNIVFV